MMSRREYLGSSRFGNVTASGMNARTMSHSASVRSVGYGVRIHPSAAVPRTRQISCGIFCRTPSKDQNHLIPNTPPRSIIDLLIECSDLSRKFASLPLPCPLERSVLQELSL